MLSCEFCRISKNTLFAEHLQTIASVPDIIYSEISSNNEDCKSVYFYFNALVSLKTAISTLQICIFFYVIIHGNTSSVKYFKYLISSSHFILVCVLNIRIYIFIHIETSQLIYSVNQSTGFCMVEIRVFLFSVHIKEFADHIKALISSLFLWQLIESVEISVGLYRVTSTFWWDYIRVGVLYKPLFCLDFYIMIKYWLTLELKLLYVYCQFYIFSLNEMDKTNNWRKLWL